MDIVVFPSQVSHPAFPSPSCVAALLRALNSVRVPIEAWASKDGLRAVVKMELQLSCVFSEALPWLSLKINVVSSP